MARIRRIHEIINGKLPSYNSAFIKVRGLAFPLDIFLKGRARFSRKLGAQLSIWVPENASTLADSLSVTQNKAVLKDLIPWLVPGSKIRLNNQLFSFVDDVVDDGYGILLTENPLANMPIGAPLELYGHPLEMNASYPGTAAYAYAVGSISAIAGISIVEGETFTLNDGINAPVVFEFDSNNSVVESANLRKVAFTTLDSSTILALSIATAINNAPVLTIEAATYNSLVSLTNTIAGPEKNQTIADTVANSNFSTTGMSGGAGPVGSLPPGISLISDHKIYLTDAINVGSFDYEVTESLLVQTLPDGRFQYQLTVSPGIPYHLDVGRQDQAYLRAHPAYESLPLAVPTASNTVVNSIGPFLFDRVSGPFFTDMNVEETDIVTLYDTSGGVISTSILGKNVLVSGIPISADCFLFWDRVRGKMQWDGNREAFKSITDSSGVSHIHYQCVPTIKPGQFTSWRCLIETTVDTKMVVELEPNTNQEFILPAGVQTAVVINFPVDSDPIERIHVLFSTDIPESVVYMKGWQIDTLTVGSISHATVAKVSGHSVWASSGAMAKPFFLKLDYIKAQADLLAKLDAGLIAL